jgi:hypothetical protein
MIENSEKLRPNYGKLRGKWCNRFPLKTPSGSGKLRKVVGRLSIEVAVLIGID